ncbi:MAG: peroxiredoxin [Parachlamydiaceae bacterium]
MTTDLSSSIKNVKIGDIAPNFKAETTAGCIDFHDWIGDAWCLFFSHPKDFTPVCTTELGEVARLKEEFDHRNTKAIALSVCPLKDHQEWIKDINETQHTVVNYPVISDENGSIAHLYGMIHPNASDTFTVRNVFIIDPKKRVRLMLIYPASTGRNFKEILRVLDSLQLTDHHSVATPANWEWGEECVILPSITDQQTLNTLFPKGYKQIKPYLRLTPQPD